jgi:hypothetical protein
MMNISITKLPRGNGTMLHSMMFLCLSYDDLERNIFYDEYFFVIVFMTPFCLLSQKIL